MTWWTLFGFCALKYRGVKVGMGLGLGLMPFRTRPSIGLQVSRYSQVRLNALERDELEPKKASDAAGGGEVVSFAQTPAIRVLS